MHNLRRDEARRDEEIRDDENLSTADIAARKPQLVKDQRRAAESGDVPIEVRQTQGPQQSTEERAALFPENELREMRSRWDAIQTGFVDEPRRAVEQGDGLVAHAIKRMADQFAQERSNLEQQWGRGGDASTEDLRQALRRYRSFFDRLLSV